VNDSANYLLASEPTGFPVFGAGSVGINVSDSKCLLCAGACLKLWLEKAGPAEE
jgi:hypothetical protein